MANVKIGNLPATSSLNPTDVLPVVDVGADTTYKITVQNLANSLTEVSQSISASHADNGGVTSIIAGSGISIDTSTGDVTITNTGGGGAAFPYTGSAKITGSLTVDGPLRITGSINTSAGVRTVDGVFIKTAGGTYNNYFALDGNDNLSIPSYGSTPYGIKIVDSGGNLFANFLGSATPQFVFTGSAKINGDLNVVNGGVTSSLFGTSSWALNVVGGASSFPFTGSAQITGSLGVTGSVSAPNGGFTGSLLGTSSWASNAINAQTASYLNPLVQNVFITGSLIVSGANGGGVFSQGASYVDAGGITTNGSYTIWRAPFSCSVVGVYGYQEGGTTTKINAAKSSSAGYQLHSATDVTLTNQGGWYGASSLQNQNYNTGDWLKIVVSGSNATLVTVQVDFIRKI